MNALNVGFNVRSKKIFWDQSFEGQPFWQLVGSNELLPLKKAGVIPFTEGWNCAVFEFIFYAQLIEITSEAGYLDFKEIIFGNNISKAVSLSIHVSKVGKG